MTGNLISAPKYIALDSSILGKLARDWQSSEKSRRRRIKEVFGRLTDSGVFLFLTWHHIEELMRHENDHVVEMRFAFLSAIPLLAWCSHYRGEMDLGGVLDLGAYEVEVFEGGLRSALEIAERVRPRLIRVGSGSELIERNIDNWLVVRPFVIERISREREIASITHRPLFPHTEGVTLGEALALKTPPEGAPETHYTWFRNQVRERISKQADLKITDPSATAERFTSLVVNDRLAAARELGLHPLLALFQNSGLDLTSVSPDTQIDELASMSTFAGQLKVIFNYMRRSKVSINVLRDGLTPSLAFCKELHTRTASLPRAAGSDIADRYMACFALYLDYFHVDKRTNEFIRQIRKDNPPFVQSLGSVFTAGTVDDFIKRVRSFTTSSS